MTSKSCKRNLKKVLSENRKKKLTKLPIQSLGLEKNIFWIYFEKKFKSFKKDLKKKFLMMVSETGSILNNPKKTLVEKDFKKVIKTVRKLKNSSEEKKIKRKMNLIQNFPLSYNLELKKTEKKWYNKIKKKSVLTTQKRKMKTSFLTKDQKISDFKKNWKQVRKQKIKINSKINEIPPFQEKNIKKQQKDISKSNFSEKLIEQDFNHYSKTKLRYIPIPEKRNLNFLNFIHSNFHKGLKKEKKELDKENISFTFTDKIGVDKIRSGLFNSFEITEISFGRKLKESDLDLSGQDGSQLLI
jgi:hypothetical protein